MPSDPTDEELIEGIKNGRQQMINYLYANFFPPIKGQLMKYGATREQAEDAFQEVLTALYLKLEREPLVLENCKLKTYITSCCIKKWLNVARRKKFKAGTVPEEMVDLADQYDIEDTLQEAARYKFYRAHLNKLPEACQKLLHEFMVELTPLEEVAKMLGYTYEYARKKSSKCQKKLTANIQNDPKFEDYKS